MPFDAGRFALMRRSSLLGELLRSVVGLLVVVVCCVAALHWVYEQMRPFLWLVPVIVVLVAAMWVWRRFYGWRL